MGFQFNHVGGGTKTRRPITLHMKYNSACVQPHCYLVSEEIGEQDVSLEELQVRERERKLVLLEDGFVPLCPQLPPATAALCRAAPPSLTPSFSSLPPSLTPPPCNN